MISKVSFFGFLLCFINIFSDISFEFLSWFKAGLKSTLNIPDLLGKRENSLGNTSKGCSTYRLNIVGRGQAQVISRFLDIT